MKFVELKKTLKTKIDNAYIIFGSDRFLQSKSMNLINSNCIDDFKEMNEIELNNSQKIIIQSFSLTYDEVNEKVLAYSIDGYLLER